MGEPTSTAPPALGILARGPLPGPTARSANAAALPTWTNISSTAGPLTSRCCDAMAYDAADGYTVLFGGHGACGQYCNDTWIFNGTSWRELALTVAPPARQFASMAYDPFDREVVLFGGIGVDGVTPLSDTWAFSAGQWHEVQTVGTPPGRWAAGMAADLTDGYVLLFGGYAGGNVFLNDTWGFVGGNWIALDPAHAPPARWTPSMTFDPAQGGVLLFGGFSGSLGFLADTWLYSYGDWRQLPTHLYPPPREKAMMDDDPLWGGPVLFGGDSCPVGCTTEVPTHLFNDTELFSDGVWENETAAIGPNPGAQCCGAMAYDWDTGKMLEVGTQGPADLQGSVWSLSAPPGTVGLQVQSVEAFPLNVTQGDYVTVLVAADPGAGSLHFSYQGLPLGCSSSNTAWMSCPATQVGHYTVAVTVSNSSGGSETETASFTVVPPPLTPPAPVTIPSWVPWATAALVVGAVVLVLVWNYRFRRTTAEAPAGDRPKGAPEAATEGSKGPGPASSEDTAGAPEEPSPPS